MKFATFFLTFLFACNVFAFASKTCVKDKESLFVEVVSREIMKQPKSYVIYSVQQTRLVNGKGVKTVLFKTQDSAKADVQAQKKVDELVKKKYTCS